MMKDQIFHVAATTSGAAVLGVISGIVFFLPSLIARFWRVSSWDSIMAINALMMLTCVAALAMRWLVWCTLALWIGSTAWAIGSRQKREPNHRP